MLGGEVRAQGAALAGELVRLLEGHLVVAAVARPDLEDALDVHLDDVGAGQAVARREEPLEDRVVEGLGAEQADRQAQPARDLAGLAHLHRPGGRGHAAHADERDALGAALDRVVVGEQVGRVGVARPGGGDDVVAGTRHHGHRAPRRAVALEAAHQRRVDDVVLERVDEQRRHEAAVLADRDELGVGGARQQDVAEAPDLVVGALAAEAVAVDLALPVAKARAGARAHRAAASGRGCSRRARPPRRRARAGRRRPRRCNSSTGYGQAMTHAAHPVHSPEVTTSLKSSLHWGFSGATGQL